jgi:hypothetical protein
VLLVLLNRMNPPAKWASDLPVFLKFAIKGHLRFSSHTSIVPDWPICSPILDVVAITSEGSIGYSTKFFDISDRTICLILDFSAI